MTKKKVYLIEEPMYGIPLHIFIGTYNEYDAWAAKTFKVERSEQKNFGGESCLIHGNGKADVLIWMPRFDNDAVDISTLSHECFHIMAKVAKVIGIKPDLDNTEPLAYLLQWYFRNSLRMLTE